MLIAVNAGNSRVLLGGYEGDEQVFAASIATDPRQMPEDYACRLQQVLGLYGVEAGRIHGAVIGSVVPDMVAVLEAALRLLGVTSGPSSPGRSVRTAWRALWRRAPRAGCLVLW